MCMFLRNAICAAGTLFVMSGVGYAQTTQVGNTVDASTIVTGSGAGGNREIRQDSPIFRDDRLNANQSGNAQIILVDDTKIVVGPNSQVDIDDFAYSSDNTFATLTVRASRGAFRFVSGNSPSTAYKIATPTGTIGVRGTTFDIQVGDRTEATVVDGSIIMCPNNRRNNIVGDPEGCTELSGWCSYAAMSNDGVEDVGRLPEKAKEEREDKFPLMAEMESELNPQFRQQGISCASDLAALIDPRIRAQVNDNDPPGGNSVSPN